MLQYPDDYINRVLCGDCLDIMKGIPDNSIDLVVTSPPYNIMGKSINPKIGKFYTNYTDDLSDAEYQQLIGDCIKICLSKSRYIAFNMQMLVGNKSSIIWLLLEYQSYLKDIFIWKKKMAIAHIQKGRMATGYEFVFLFGKDNSMIFSYNNFPPNNYVPNIQQWRKSFTIEEHHAIFPTELPSYFIRHFTKPGDIILDPFLGTGTTAIAATNLGRKFIGIDIEPKYCSIARKRLEFERQLI